MAEQLKTSLTILRRKQVEKKVALTCSTIYARMAAGTFPRNIPLGAKARGWIELEINKYIQARIAGCSDEQIRVLVAKMHAARSAEGWDSYSIDKLAIDSIDKYIQARIAGYSDDQICRLIAAAKSGGAHA